LSEQPFFIIFVDVKLLRTTAGKLNRKIVLRISLGIQWRAAPSGCRETRQITKDTDTQTLFNRSFLTLAEAALFFHNVGSGYRLHSDLHPVSLIFSKLQGINPRNGNKEDCAVDKRFLKRPHTNNNK
jgi:hypothetical protein